MDRPNRWNRYASDYSGDLSATFCDRVGLNHCAQFVGEFLELGVLYIRILDKYHSDCAESKPNTAILRPASMIFRGRTPIAAPRKLHLQNLMCKWIFLL